MVPSNPVTLVVPIINEFWSLSSVILSLSKDQFRLGKILPNRSFDKLRMTDRLEQNQTRFGINPVKIPLLPLPLILLILSKTPLPSLMSFMFVLSKADPLIP